MKAVVAPNTTGGNGSSVCDFAEHVTSSLHHSALSAIGTSGSAHPNAQELGLSWFVWSRLLVRTILIHPFRLLLANNLGNLLSISEEVLDH